MLPILSAQQVPYEMESTHIGPLSTGVYSNQSHVTALSILYDATVVPGLVPSTRSSSVSAATNPLALFKVSIIHSTFYYCPTSYYHL